MNLETAKIALNALKFAFDCIEDATDDECDVIQNAISILESAIAQSNDH